MPTKDRNPKPDDVQSGRTTIAKALVEEGYHYINSSDWVKTTFRPQYPNEDNEQYNSEYQKFYFNRLKINPYLCIDNTLDVIEAIGKDNKFVIDGIENPKDFIQLFNFS